MQPICLSWVFFATRAPNLLYLKLKCKTAKTLATEGGLSTLSDDRAGQNVSGAKTIIIMGAHEKMQYSWKPLVCVRKKNHHNQAR